MSTRWMWMGVALALVGTGYAVIAGRKGSAGPSDERRSHADGRPQQPARPDPSTERLARLEQRLLGLERGVASLNDQKAVDDKVAVHAKVDSAPLKGRAPQRFGSNHVGRWMLERIRGEEWDSVYTRRAEEELERTLAEASAELNEVECGDRFCRAVILGLVPGSTGLVPLLDKLPLNGGAFTELGEQGELALFFPRKGFVLEDLTREARQAWESGELVGEEPTSKQ